MPAYQWLLIDDDLDDQEIFCLAAQDVKASIDCVCEADSIEAVRKLNADAAFIPDCIFIDMNMPRMNGRQCLLEIRKIERLCDTPIFMCSTSSDPKVIAETKSLGAADFIVKPSTLSEFTHTLRKVYHSLTRPTTER